MSNSITNQLLKAIDALEAGQLPDLIPDMENHWNLPDVQSTFQTNGMFGLVDLHWTKHLAKELAPHRVLEIMAGRGWHALALAAHGVNITATDGYLSHGTSALPPAFPVLNYAAAEAVRTFAAQSDALLCSWPPYDSPDLRHALVFWPTHKPIYIIGECYGCTADEDFWAQFQVEEQFNWQPNLYGQHSRIYRGFWPGGVK